MMTRRQKKSIHAFVAVLSTCAMLAGFLIFTNISNTRATEPVVFAEILEGAIDYSDGEPAVTLPDSALTETMFADEMATFTMTLPPGYTSYSETKPTLITTAASVTYITPDEDTTVKSDSSDETTTSETLPLLSNEPAVHETETTAAATSDTTTSSAATSKASSSAVTTTNRDVTYITTVSTRAPQTTTSAMTTTPKTTVTTTASTTTSRTAVTTTTAKTTADETEKPPFTNVGGGTFSTDTNVYLTMFRLVNNARKEAGLNELWYSARIHEVCELRTTELTSYYSHTRPDGSKFSTAFKEKGVSYSICGENIAYGKNMFKTAEEVFQAWMESPSHRENILNPKFECAAFGLSILKVGSDTYYYWSQEFAKL